MKSFLMVCLLVVSSALQSQFAFAAVNVAKSKQVAPSKILQGSGSIIGGVAGTGFSLLDLRKTQNAKSKIERIVFDIGDLRGRTQKGLPGYYHVQMLQNPNRLVIDFAQMPASKINAQEVQKRLASSMFIKSTELALDPVDQSLNLVLFLKNKPKAKVFQVAGKKSTSKVVVDLTL